MTFLQFPEGFWWGTAASAAQTEGTLPGDGRGRNVWDDFYDAKPERFFDRVGPEDTSTFLKSWRSDLDLLVETGQTTYRTSIGWSRLIPEGTGEVNPKAVEFYNAVFDRMIELGVEPFVTLYHFDMPSAMHALGGFESREVVDAFAAYARTCFELFGDRVKKWFTFNEPIVPVEGGYFYDFHWPLKLDPKAGIQVAYHTTLASARAIAEYRDLGQDGRIGIVVNLTPSYPRSEHPADLRAAHIADLMFNQSFLDPAVKGAYPAELVELLAAHDLTPDTEPGDAEVIAANTVDFLGVNYYQPRRVAARASAPNPEAPWVPEFYFDNYVMPGRKMNVHRGWEIYERGVYDIAINLRDNYGNIDWYVSENGMGVEGEEKFRAEDGSIDDQYRIDFIKDHLRNLHAAIQEGCHVRGYHLWTFIDNWSWSNAYKNRYGLVGLDLATQERKIKSSGRWYKQLTADNGFEV